MTADHRKSTYIRYPENDSKWEEADQFIKNDDGTATAEGWGERFENQPLLHEPSDRFTGAVDYIKVQHSSGNWLKLFRYT